MRRVHGDPTQRLDFISEAKKFQKRLPKIRTKEDLRLIYAFASQIKLDAKIKTITTIPVHTSEKNLNASLGHYAVNSAQSQTHYFIIFLNADHRVTKARFNRSALSQHKQIKRALQTNNMTILQHHFNKSRIGQIRGLIADALVISALNARLKDPILIINDADPLFVPSDYISRVKKVFSQNPSMDLIGGRVYWGGYGPGGKNYLPTQRLLPELLLFDLFVTADVRAKMHLVDKNLHLGLPSGPSIAVRLASLCAFDGFNYKMKWNEDGDLFIRALEMRRYHLIGRSGQPFSDWVQETYVVTDPRRHLNTIIKKKITSFSISGGNLQLRELIKQYCASKTLIQARDLRSASRGESPAINKIVRQTKVLLERFSSIQSNPHPKYWIEMGQILGLSFKSTSLVGTKKTDIQIDWAKSPLFKRLMDWSKGLPFKNVGL